MGKDNTFRPVIDLDLVKKIKEKYPDETALLGNKATLVWALNRFLDIEELTNY